MSDSSVEGFDGLQPPAVVLTPQEVLQAGLVLVNCTSARMCRAQVAKTNLKRFRDHFGCNPVVSAQMFSDLQTTTTQEARVEESKIVGLLVNTIKLNFLFFQLQRVTVD